jgi:formylglycine-generating enzyme required for sulfatase activity
VILFVGLVSSLGYVASKRNAKSLLISPTPYQAIYERGINIADNLFCDQTAVTCFEWNIYTDWIKSVFGANSPEYKQVLSNSNVWNEELYYGMPYMAYYAEHVAYAVYPIVGITQQQAIDYSKWRSDRVFEKMLIDSLRLKKEEPTSENYFTIEKYFNGELDDRVLGEKVQHYLEYRLPTLEERTKVLHYADSVNTAYLDKCKSEICKQCKQDSSYIQCKKQFDDRRPLPVLFFKDCQAQENGIYNANGNVSEWIAEPSTASGANYKYNKVLPTDTFHTQSATSWIGFRNVCQWKEWEK